MLDIAFQHIGDGLDAAMRMPGEALQILLGIIISEVIHHQERVEHVGVAKAEHAVEMDASTLHCGGGARLELDGTDRHSGLCNRGNCKLCVPLHVGFWQAESRQRYAASPATKPEDQAHWKL